MQEFCVGVCGQRHLDSVENIGNLHGRRYPREIRSGERSNDEPGEAGRYATWVLEEQAHTFVGR